MNDYKKALSDNILAYKKKKKWTNLRTAMECEVSLAEYNKIVYGFPKELYLSTVLKISENTKIPIGVLLGMEGGAGR